MSNFCSKCGSALPANTKFCPGCGTPVGQTAPVTQTPANAHTQFGAQVPPAAQVPPVAQAQPVAQTPPVYAGNGEVRRGIPAPGFSDRVNHREVLAAVKKNRRAGAVFGFFLVPLPLVGFII